MTMEYRITGDPRWGIAMDMLKQLREMPAVAAEAEIEQKLYSTLQNLFPNLPYPEIAVQYQSGDGPIDVYCRNVVFETKRPGRKDDARVKPDGSTETPEEQALRYLNALSRQNSLFDYRSIGWRACVTDGREWSFYHYDRNANELKPDDTLRLEDEPDDEALLSKLFHFVDRTTKMSPPVDNQGWANDLAEPFLDLAARYERTTEYQVKLDLWRNVLSGAFITPQGDANAERHLFARHTMLVALARAVAATLIDPNQPARDRHNSLADGFPNWLIDAARDEGETAIANLVSIVNRYEWRRSNRDTLKDLYHAVIPRDIRHDFGEYYTPDWLARAVCEQVMDADWRAGVIEAAVNGELNGAAALDPACGSGTFLYHAVQLLLETARLHPELAGSPQTQVEVVNKLVAGLDLHPIAVELAKTTKMLAFGDLPTDYGDLIDSPNIYLGDSLQWETRSLSGAMAFGQGVDLPSEDPENPIRLPRSLLLRDRFHELLERIFDYANGEQNSDTEANLVALMNLSTEQEQEMLLDAYRRLRGYIQSGRNNVWKWYISNLVQPHRLSTTPATRLVGNPPWVVYNAMDADRQDVFRRHAAERGLWEGANLATQNDIAATFVAACVDYYLQRDGKFGFVLPYAALRARHWGKFRSGNWSSAKSSEAVCHVDLSAAAWDLQAVNDPPFKGSAHASVIFGKRVQPGSRQKPNIKPLGGVQKVAGSGIDKRMDWNDVKPLLTFTASKQWKTAPSPAYASQKFYQGATLVPQSLVVFDESNAERALGTVHFRTEKGKGAWKGLERHGRIEERFAKPALFSKHIVPFGTIGQLNIIAPFSEDGARVMNTFPGGDDAQAFNIYWSKVDSDYIATKKPKSPPKLANQIDYLGKLTRRLQNDGKAVVYTQAGSWLASAVVPASTMIDSTLYWFAADREAELHYLSAVFNSPALAEFFHIEGRASDRHFHTGPIRNLPIPGYDAADKRHAELAAQSVSAHARVAALVAERQSRSLRTSRKDVLADAAVKAVLARIDGLVRQMLPDYCS